MRRIIDSFVGSAAGLAGAVGPRDHWRRRGVLVLLCSLLGGLSAAPPEIEVTSVTQARAGAAKLVLVHFRSRDADGNPLKIILHVSADGGASWTAVPVLSLSGDTVVAATDAWRGGCVRWAAGKDWPEQVSAQMQVKLGAEELPLPEVEEPRPVPVPAGFSRIPAGSFIMGNQEDEDEGLRNELEPHTVYVSTFCIDRWEMTRSQWDQVETWAGQHGYEFDHDRHGKEADHPVYDVSWFDVLRWCNARSEKEGREPCYFDEGRVFRDGLNDEVTCDWSANGYRLPSEAEWEKAARGGLKDRRFPWGDAISHDRANYRSTFWLRYDESSTFGYHPDYNEDGLPFTSPVGSFSPSGYGLYDVAGNVWEWCWDRLDEYPSGAQTDPHGPRNGWARVVRGGSYADDASRCRVSARGAETPGKWLGGPTGSVGFRLAVTCP